MDQIIPDTDNLEVAKVAAAMWIVTKAHVGDNPTEERLEAFKKAYQAISDTVGANRPTAKARSAQG